jgi:phage gp37-like protein
MSATILLDQVVARVRAKFTKAEVASVEKYAGEFSAAEIPFKSYNCPAIFVTVQGWQPADSDCRLSGKHANKVRMAAFVAFKHADRNKRMAGAMLLAERLGIVMRQWEPMREVANANLPVTIAGLEADATCENLYGRALDAAGQALFLVDWQQCVKPAVPMEQLWDLLSIEIIDSTRGGMVPPDAAATGVVPVVTDDVKFVQN